MDSNDSTRKLHWNKKTSDFPVALPAGRSLYPHQIATVEYLTKYRRAMVLDPAGLGKTPPLIIGATNIGADLVVVFCPPSLVTAVWETELRAWAPGYHITIVKNGKLPFKIQLGAVTVIPYSLLHTPAVTDAFLEAAATIRAFESVVILDEAHACKNPTSKRTKAARQYSRLFDNVWLATGTPQANRVNDLWAQMDICNPSALGMSYEAFLRKFTVFENTSRGLRIYGSQNLGELSEMLKNHFMIRRSKADVLKNLPPKVVSVKYIEVINPPQPTEEMRFELEQLLDKNQAPKSLLSAYLSDLSLVRAKAAIDYLVEAAKCEPIVIFGVYRATLDLIRTALEKDHKQKCSMIVGDTPTAERAGEVTKFQTGETRVFIGNIVAAGTGITLTQASRLIFIDVSWSPGDMSQAEDRIHRIGQKDFCRVEYLVAKGTFDEVIVQVVKKKTADAAKTVGDKQGV